MVAFTEKKLQTPDEKCPGGAFVEIADNRDVIRNEFKKAGGGIEEDDEAEKSQKNDAYFFQHEVDLREKRGGVEALISACKMRHRNGPGLQNLKNTIKYGKSR